MFCRSASTKRRVKDEVQGLFDDIVAGFPQEKEIAPGRKLFEHMRRKATADAKAAIKND